MGFAERAAARKKSKDLKNELKELQKQMLATNGGEKAALASTLKELGAALELGATLYADYTEAGMHLAQAQQMIGILLEHMGASPAEEVQASLCEIMGHLDGLTHDCSIRGDDTDFASTLQCLKQMAKEYSADTAGMQAIMLRSELENVKAVLDDAAGWNAPDFLALAYYYQHADKDTLRDMENEQRNQFVRAYFQKGLLDELSEQLCRAGREAEVQNLQKKYIYS